ncbi:Rqc2 family fibronectin-binding protein [Thermotalea metallivorans]|uniref:Rqc2 homolog RqcH n=1 Tax=Thermotalea metallivorans TaxID=520762 RepID=A0A140L601_9FIRM|nr:NFACT RNA binding domain-containing protein [Thermotalea metallivorans]KXG75976.1 hypothetical protein AN619_14400 [Thermotalea metallivorans]
MPLDGLVISAVVHELKEKILYGKIEKIYQPEIDEINLHIRCLGKSYRLLISASSHHPRIHLTATAKQNPPSPPMFCMLMRKHLQGGKILSVQQKEFERIIAIDVENYDELGSLSVKQLIVEIMGKHSNVVLVEKSQNKIIDSIKRISGDVNRYREILPGKIYIAPPGQDKVNPLLLNKDSFLSLFHRGTKGCPVQKALYTFLQGISPVTAREICYRAQIDEDLPMAYMTMGKYDALWDALTNLLQNVTSSNYIPNIIIGKSDRHVIDFSSIPLKHYEHLYDAMVADSISNILEDYYAQRDLHERLKQKSIDLRKFIVQTLDRLYKKMQKLLEELTASEKSEEYRIFGELLTANLHLIQKGNTEAEVINYYDEEGKTVKIPLDARLSPAQNAQRYFKKYAKAKTAVKEIKVQLEESENEIKYFENLLVYVENAADIQDLEDVRNELIEEGYLRKRKDKEEKIKRKSVPLSFISSDGFQILVGKNNKQNDALTCKIASKKDLWFHTKDIPGSHVVVISNQQSIPETTILEAAELAAFHSKGKLSGNVPVDYTEIKNVRKPSGAKPGMVIYDNHKTLYVTPRHDIAARLRQNKTESH